LSPKGAIQQSPRPIEGVKKSLAARRILDLLGIEIPIIQAPMADSVALARAVS